MELLFIVDRLIHRKNKQTEGKLKVIVNNVTVYECICLELPYKNNQRRVSSVPEGVYDIVLEYSPAFKTVLWELKGVPNRSECKIHVANYVNQLNGCIAPGLKWADINKDGLLDATDSKKALAKIMDVTKVFAKGKIRINDKYS